MRHRILVVEGNPRDHYAARLYQALDLFGYKGIEVVPVPEFHPGYRAFGQSKRDGVDLVVVVEVKEDGSEFAVWAGYDPSMFWIWNAMNHFFPHATAKMRTPEDGSRTPRDRHRPRQSEKTTGFGGGPISESVDRGMQGH